MWVFLTRRFGPWKTGISGCALRCSTKWRVFQRLLRFIAFPLGQCRRTLLACLTHNVSSLKSISALRDVTRKQDASPFLVAIENSLRRLLLVATEGLLLAA